MTTSNITEISSKTKMESKDGQLRSEQKQSPDVSASVKPEKKLTWKHDSIDDYMTLEAFISHNGIDKAERLRRYAKNRVTLNEEVDEPLPEWADRIMMMGPLSFKARVRIVSGHNDKIKKFRKTKTTKEQ